MYVVLYPFQIFFIFFLVICIINQVEKACQESGLTCHSPCVVSKDKDLLHSNSEVQLWPVYELMCIILSGALRRVLMSSMRNSITSHQQNEISDECIGSTLPLISCQSIAKNLSSIMLPLPSVPPSLVSMIKLLTESNELLTDTASNGFKNIISKLIIMMLQHSELSPSVRQVKDWLSWKQEDSSVENSANGMPVEANKEVSQ